MLLQKMRNQNLKIDLILRKAQAADLPKIFEVFKGAIHSTAVGDYSIQQLEVWSSSTANLEKWETRIHSQYFLVAEVDAEIIGFASVDPLGYLDLMYVHPNYNRRGVAHQLYQEIEIYCRSVNCREIKVNASKTAVPFFKKMKFTTIHENHFEIEGIEISNFRMVKVI